MNKKVITKVLEIAGHLKHVYVATADREGLPHVSVAGKLQITSEGDLAVSEWFCPGTLSNAQANPKVSLVFWRPDDEEGYQILGKIIEIRDLAMLDGYSPELGEGVQIPQVQRQLIVRPEKVL